MACTSRTWTARSTPGTTPGVGIWTFFERYTTLLANDSSIAVLNIWGTAAVGRNGSTLVSEVAASRLRSTKAADPSVADSTERQHPREEVRRTLADFPERGNSLNFLRLVLAVLVIVSHSWPIGGYGPDPELGQFSLGSIAVAGFFAISGWLITRSRLSSELASFMWRRFCRIYPGYLMVLLAVAFVFAPIGAALSSGAYKPSDGIAYVGNNIGLYTGPNRGRHLAVRIPVVERIAVDVVP